jgi:hypothetical protein
MENKSLRDTQALSPKRERSAMSHHYLAQIIENQFEFAKL